MLSLANRNKFEFATMIKKNKRQSKYFAPQNEAGVQHKCDHPGCNKPGEYRAPKNTKLKEYYWFCLEHVQEYNSKWNYYENENDEVQGEDNHPHFKFSSHIKYNFGFDFKEGYDFFSSGNFYEQKINIALTAEERQGLKIMELNYDDLDVATLKKAYKKAVKKYHPDINGSNRQAEELFKIVSTSYKSLLNKLSS